jgi:hypothetical protein
MFRKSNLLLLAAIFILGAATLGTRIGSLVAHQVVAAEHNLGIDWLNN